MGLTGAIAEVVHEHDEDVTAPVADGQVIACMPTCAAAEPSWRLRPIRGQQFLERDAEQLPGGVVPQVDDCGEVDVVPVELPRQRRRRRQTRDLGAAA